MFVSWPSFGDIMRFSAALALSIVVCSGPTLADSARLTGLPAGLLAGAAAEGTQHVVPNLPIAPIQAGSATIILGQTALPDLKQQFGGTLRHAGEGGESVDWLCYAMTVDGRASQVWFVSDGKAGGPEHQVTLVASDFPATPATDCDPAGGGLTGLTWQVPALGASHVDLKQAFGVVAAENGLVAYLHQIPGEGGGLTLQTLNYLLTDGNVTGLAAEQITAK